jgi:hypothetical protein
MQHIIKLTIVTSGNNHADALKRVQERIEPPGKERADNLMYIKSVDSVTTKDEVR